MSAEQIFDRYGVRYAIERMSAHTTFGVGGEALIAELDTDSAASVLIALESEGIPFTLIGNGSNMLVSDDRLDRVFVHMGRGIADITVQDETIICGAGAPLSAVCIKARDMSLTGLEFAYGIPASVGGAVFMDAGAYGGELKDVLTRITAVTDGKVRTFTADELDLGYRHSRLMDERIYCLSAEFALSRGDKAQITARMEELMGKRRDKQPLDMKSAGSTFKRPQGAYAAALIEQCGLKGYTVGGAQVSTKHSGFVVNTGTASFDDVMAVIAHVQRVVKDKTGFDLETEPEIIR